MKRLLKRALHRAFVTAQAVRLDMLPRHFYSEIPDLRRLRRSAAWKAPYSMIGVDGADPEAQLIFLRQVMTPRSEQSGLAYDRACADNGAPGYGVAEAQFLFQYIVRFRPRRIVQIGAGVATSVMLQAADSAGHALDLVCIDPFPTAYLRRLAKDGRIVSIDRPVEETDPATVDALAAGDLLFIDSTHTLGPAGEATRLILEWLPRVKTGVDVHFHDIMFPYDYMPDLLDGALFFPHETPLLHAFLCMNPNFAIRCSLAMLHHARPRELAALLPHYQAPATDAGLAVGPGHIPSAIILKRVR